MRYHSAHSPPTISSGLTIAKHGFCSRPKPLRVDQRSSIPRHVLQNLGDDVVCSNAFGFRFEVEDETMAQGGGGHGFDVVEADVESPFGKRPNFAPQKQCLAAARTAAEPEILIGDGR